MNKDSQNWLENTKGMIWFKRYIMLNAMNTALILIIYFYFAYLLLGSFDSTSDLPAYVMPLVLILISAILMVAVLSVWVRTFILRKYMPAKVGIDRTGIIWTSLTEETKVQWESLRKEHPVKLENEKIVEVLVSGLVKSGKDESSRLSTGSSFYNWIFKRLMIDAVVVEGMKEGYNRYLLSKS
jgi:hypothetical protein